MMPRTNRNADSLATDIYDFIMSPANEFACLAPTVDNLIA